MQGAAESFRQLSKCNAICNGFWILFLDSLHAYFVNGLASRKSRRLVNLPGVVWGSD